MPSTSRGLVLLLLASTLSACADGSTADSVDSAGVVRIDGSSSVFPISNAVVGEFAKLHPIVGVRLTISGTGGGFQNFCRGRIDIAAAARPIRRSETEACERSAVSFVELPIAYDGIAVVVNRRATWVDTLSLDELRRLWTPEAQGRVNRWNQIRSTWPDRDLHLFGPDPSSGTYDYFTAAIVGEEGASRHDFTDSADDDLIVARVANDELALAYLPLAYYEKNRDRVKAVAIGPAQSDGGRPAVPSRDTIAAGTYPLARPVFIYVREQALNRTHVKRFVDFYLARVGSLAEPLGYLQLGESAYQLIAERSNARWTGTVFGGGGSQVGLTVQQLIEKTRIK